MWDAIGLVVSILVYTLTTTAGVVAFSVATNDADRWAGLVVFTVGSIGLFAEFGR